MSDEYDEIRQACDENIAAMQRTLTEAAVQLAQLRNKTYGLKGDYIEIIKGLRKKCDAVAKADYERGFDDGFILRKEKDGNGQSEYICTCGIRVTPHKCPTDNGF